MQYWKGSLAQPEQSSKRRSLLYVAAKSQEMIYDVERRTYRSSTRTTTPDARQTGNSRKNYTKNRNLKNRCVSC